MLGDGMTVIVNNKGRKCVVSLELQYAKMCCTYCTLNTFLYVLLLSNISVRIVTLTLKRLSDSCIKNRTLHHKLLLPIQYLQNFSSGIIDLGVLNLSKWKGILMSLMDHWGLCRSRLLFSDLILSFLQDVPLSSPPPVIKDSLETPLVLLLPYCPLTSPLTFHLNDLQRLLAKHGISLTALAC